MFKSCVLSLDKNSLLAIGGCRCGCGYGCGEGGSMRDT